MAGYSGTALVKKLGIKQGFAIHTIGAPPEYRALVQPLPAGVKFVRAVTGETNMVHVFETERDRLAPLLADVRKRLAPDASVWVSWPKQASKVPTTITDHVIRALALPLGFVDIKVCAVTEVWSASMFCAAFLAATNAARQLTSADPGVTRTEAIHLLTPRSQTAAGHPRSAPRALCRIQKCVPSAAW
jgi:hypothetical protein